MRYDKTAILLPGAARMEERHEHGSSVFSQVEDIVRRAGALFADRDLAGCVPCLAAGSVDIAAAGGPVHSELLALV